MWSVAGMELVMKPEWHISGQDIRGTALPLLSSVTFHMSSLSEAQFSTGNSSDLLGTIVTTSIRII